MNERVIPIHAGVVPMGEGKEPNEHVIAVLKSLLEQAERGEIQELAGAFTCGMRGGTFGTDNISVQLIGVIAILQNSLLHGVM